MKIKEMENVSHGYEFKHINYFIWKLLFLVYEEFFRNCKKEV